MINKKSGITFEAIYPRFRSPPSGVNVPSSLLNKLPPLDKIKRDRSAPQDKPSAIAFVSSEDANNDGIKDVHLVIPNLESHFSKFNPEDLNDPAKFLEIIYPFVDLFAHEDLHIQKYDPQSRDFKPHGEGEAEAAGASAVGELKSLNPEYLKANNANVIKDLVKLSNALDAKGLFKEADFIDSIMLTDIEHKLTYKKSK